MSKNEPLYYILVHYHCNTLSYFLLSIQYIELPNFLYYSSESILLLNIPKTFYEIANYIFCGNKLNYDVKIGKYSNQSNQYMFINQTDLLNNITKNL